MSRSSVSLILLCLLSFTSLALAQCTDIMNAAQGSEITLSSDTYAGGSSLQGSILFVNTFNYSLPDSTLLAKVLRESATGFGSDVMGEFVVAEGLNLAPKATNRLSFSRKLPYGLSEGKYLVYFYLYSAGFNTGGASFLEDINIGSAYFSVKNDNPDYVLINRSTILLSGQPYNPAKINSEIEQQQGTNITLSFNLSNAGSAGNIDVDYRLYIWDKYRHAELKALLAKEVVQSDSDLASHLLLADSLGGTITVSMGANETKEISIPVGVLPTDVYTLEVQAKKNEARSILDVRIPVKGQRGALKFAGLLPFPLTQALPARVLACTALTTEVSGMSLGTSPAPLDAELRVEIRPAINGTMTNATLFSDLRVISFSDASLASIFDLLPEQNADDIYVTLYLSDLNGTLMDASQLHYSTGTLTKQAVLKLDSSVRAGAIKYAISLSDADGTPLNGNIVIVLKDKDGIMVDSFSSKLLGKLTGEFVAPQGGYVLEAVEGTYGLTATSANSTPYGAKEAPPQVPPPQPKKEPSQPLSPILTVFVVLLLIGLLALALYTLQIFKGKRRVE